MEIRLYGNVFKKLAMMTTSAPARLLVAAPHRLESEGATGREDQLWIQAVFFENSGFLGDDERRLIRTRRRVSDVNLAQLGCRGSGQAERQTQYHRGDDDSPLAMNPIVFHYSI